MKKKIEQNSQEMFCTQNCIMHKQISWHHHGQILYSELKVMQTKNYSVSKSINKTGKCQICITKDTHTLPGLSRTEEMHLHEKLRHFVNIGKVMWKTGKIIWIIEAKNANEVKEFFTI